MKRSGIWSDLIRTGSWVRKEKGGRRVCPMLIRSGIAWAWLIMNLFSFGGNLCCKTSYGIKLLTEHTDMFLSSHMPLLILFLMLLLFLADIPVSLLVLLSLSSFRSNPSLSNPLSCSLYAWAWSLCQILHHVYIHTSIWLYVHIFLSTYLFISSPLSLCIYVYRLSDWLTDR